MYTTYQRGSDARNSIIILVLVAKARDYQLGLIVS